MCDFKIKYMKSLKQTFLLTILMSMVSVSVFAQSTDDSDMLYVYTKGNKEAALYQLDELNKITFSSKGVRMWNTDWPTEYPYSKVSVITFRDRSYVKPTGIETTFADDDKVTICYNNSIGVVTVKSGTLLDGVAVYDLQGQLISVDNSKRQTYRISLKDVDQGVYVVKAKSKSTEAIKKIVKH